VIFCNLEDAAKARRALNGSNFLNKPIKVDFTKNDANLVQKYKSKFGGGSGAKNAANIANQVKNAAKRIAKTSGTLLVTNLPDDVLDSHLHMLFSPHDGFKELKLSTSTPKTATIEYVDDTSAAKVKEQLNGHEINGSQIIVDFQVSDQ